MSNTVTDRRLRKLLGYRLQTALDRSRRGDNVVIVVEKLEHVSHMMAELERGVQDGDIVDRSSGRWSITMRGGGRIRFAPAANPDHLRGWAQVDLFLVDPRVATSTALEESMALACRRDPQRYAIVTATVVRPGDQP